MHRSGTTLLGRLLAEHPETSGFINTGVPADEGQHLQSVYPPAREFGGPGRFAFAKESGLNETSPLVDQARNQLLDDWKPYWDTTRKVLIEKSPPNLLRFRFLQAVFPDAHLVAVLRHPIAVAYATQKWSKTSIPSLLEHWLVAHERFKNDIPLLKNLHEVRYEDLIAKSETTIASLETALDLKPQIPQGVIEKGSNESYFERWNSEKKRPLTGIKLRRATKEFEERANSFGYSIAQPIEKFSNIFPVTA